MPIHASRRSRRIGLVAAVVLAGCGGVIIQRSEPAPSPVDEQAVMATIDQLFHAMRTKDSAELRRVFIPEAKLFGMRGGANGDSLVQVMTLDRFREITMTNTRGAFIERGWNPRVSVHGTLATVWADYDFHIGVRPSHCGVDAVQLLRTRVGWQIVSIADTYETKGCPPRPVPDTTTGR